MGNPSGDLLKANIVQALTLAQQAVSADTEGDKATSLTLYEECSRQLEECIPFLPAPHAVVLTRHSAVYARRAAELKEEILGRTVKKLQLPEFPVAFADAGATAHPPPDTPALLRRPLWLMKMVSQSVQTAAQLTPQVRVTRDVWTHDGAHTAIRGVAAKTQYCEHLADLLAAHQHAFREDGFLRDPARVSACLADIQEGADAAWKRLLRELPKADTDNPGAQADRAKVGHAQRAWLALRARVGEAGDGAARTEPSVAYNSFLPWLVSLLESLQSLDPIFAHFAAAPEAATPELQARLARLSGHLFTGPCAFVLKDLFTLLYRYMRKSREAYSRLFPKNALQANKASKVLS